MKTEHSNEGLAQRKALTTDILIKIRQMTNDPVREFGLMNHIGLFFLICMYRSLKDVLSVSELEKMLCDDIEFIKTEIFKD